MEGSYLSWFYDRGAIKDREAGGWVVQIACKIVYVLNGRPQQCLVEYRLYRVPYLRPWPIHSHISLHHLTFKSFSVVSDVNFPHEY